MLIRDRVKTFSRVADGFVQRGRNQLAAFFVTNHRGANARFVIDERMREAAFDAQDFAVDAVDVTITRDRAQHFTAARTERHLTSIRTEVAGGDVLRE